MLDAASLACFASLVSAAEDRITREADEIARLMREIEAVEEEMTT